MAETQNQVWLGRFRPLEIDNFGGDVERELWVASSPLIVEFEQAGDPPSGVIPGVMTQPHQLSVDAIDANAEISVRSLPSLGDVVFGDPDGRFQEVAGWTFAQRAVDLWLGPEGEKFWRDPPVWSALCEEAQWERHEITVPTVGVEELLSKPLQPNVFTPGFEPYFIGDDVDNMIDFGSVLNRTTGGLTIGVAFRTDTHHNGFLYGRKAGITSTSAGYSLGLGSGGAVRFDIADGSINITAIFNPPGGYNDGQRHTLIGSWRVGAQVIELRYDGVLVDTTDASAIVSLSNALVLTAAASSGAVPAAHLDGELERLAQHPIGGPGAISSVQQAMDERYAEDVDANALGLDHYVPLTENTGFLVGDLSSNGFDGTLSGAANSDALWSGLQNGHAGLEGVRKPIGIGVIDHCRPILLDPIKQVYFYHDVDVNSDDGPFIVTDRGQLIPADDTPPFGPFWTSPPDAGHWRSEDGKVRINPAGLPDQIKLSVSFQNVRGQGTQNAEDAFDYVMDRVAGFETSIQPITDLRYPVGYYWRDEVTVAEAADEVVEGYSGLWSTDSRNPFTGGGIPLFRLRAVIDVNGPLPPGWVVALTIKLDPDWIEAGDALVAEDGLRRIGVAAVPDSVVLEYDRFQGFFGEGELLPTGPVDPFTLQRLAGLTNEYRKASADAPQAVLDRFNAPSPIEVRTGISGNTDAQAEADRLMALRGQMVEVWECELTGARRRFEGWVGDVVEVIGPLPTFEAGRRFMVVGVRDDADTSGSILTLWGPRPETAPP